MEDIGVSAAIGGILLVIVLAWVVMMQRRRSAADKQRTQEATKDLYARMDRQDKVTDPDTNTF